MALTTNRTTSCGKLASLFGGVICDLGKTLEIILTKATTAPKACAIDVILKSLMRPVGPSKVVVDIMATLLIECV
jgi:hypothetical protein